MEKFIPQFQPIVKKEWADAVHNQIMSGWIGPGKTVDAFESKIKELTGSKYAVSTTSGTAAIMLAIHALRIPKGKTILFPSYTFLAGANAARFMGYDVDVVDISYNTLCMNPDELKNKLEKHTKWIGNERELNIGAVIFVNHNGYVGEDVVTIKHICDLHNIPMIEDSSQALGIPNAGTVGDIGIFSFSVPKIVSTGQGGVLITNNDNISKRALEMRDHGDNWRATKIHNNIGINLKFDDIHAAYGLAQLNDLDYLLAERKRVYDNYAKHLGDFVRKDKNQESPWMIIVFIPAGVISSTGIYECIEKLKNINIQAVQYYKPLNDNPPFAHLEVSNIAKWAYDHCVYLPSSLSLSNDEIETICNVVKEFVDV